MNISVIIPNYNGEELLKKNLPKVYEELSSYKSGKTETVVVDDASTDGSIIFLDQFSKEHKDLHIQKNDRNLGFSSTVNKGVSIASGEIIVLMNTDICPEKGFLEPLLSHFKDEKVFAVGCLDKSIEGEKTVLRGRGLGEWKRGFLVHRRGEVDKPNTLWVSGGSGAFRKSIWDALGGLDEVYNPFYWEDIDLSYRALKSGFTVVFEAGSVVVHEHEKGAIKGKFSASTVKKIAYKNQFIFVWKNADQRLLLSHLIWLPYHKIKALLRLDWPFFKGLLEALMLLPKIIVSRQKAQKLFVKKDNDVIQGLI